MASSVYRYVVYFAQFRDAAGVVGVAVGAQNGVQPESVRIEEGQRRRSLAGIDHGGISIVVDRPDVIVAQGGDGGNVEHGANWKVDDAEL